MDMSLYHRTPSPTSRIQALQIFWLASATYFLWRLVYQHALDAYLYAFDIALGAGMRMLSLTFALLCSLVLEAHSLSARHFFQNTYWWFCDQLHLAFAGLGFAYFYVRHFYPEYLSKKIRGQNAPLYQYTYKSLTHHWQNERLVDLWRARYQFYRDVGRAAICSSRSGTQVGSNLHLDRRAESCTLSRRGGQRWKKKTTRRAYGIVYRVATTSNAPDLRLSAKTYFDTHSIIW